MKPEQSEGYRPVRYDDHSDGSSEFDRLEAVPLNSRFARFTKVFNFKILQSIPTASISVVIPWALVGILAGFVSFQYWHRGPSSSIFPQVLYSPVQHLLSYEKKVFKSGFGHDIDPNFQGPPSPAIDAAWDSLYNCYIFLVGPQKLNAYEAAHIPNKTWPISQEPGQYIAVIDVFHHIHCLNQIRKALNPDYYGQTHWSEEFKQDELLGQIHLGHCVDSIRQSLMCMSDISVIIWQWDQHDQQAKPVGNIPHTCRNFDALREWAFERRLIPQFDPLTYLGDDPLAGIFDYNNPATNP